MRSAVRALACVVALGTGSASLAQPIVEGAVTLPPNNQVLIDEVRVESTGSTGNKKADADALDRARREIGFGPGQVFVVPAFDSAVLRLRRIPGVRNATYSLRSRHNPDFNVLVVTLQLSASASKADGSRGLLENGRGFPTLARSETYLLTATVNGGLGAFSDQNPWFGNALTFTRGNPLVRNPPLGAQTGSVANWMEGYVQYGLAGSIQIGDTPFYGYGALNLITVGAAGRDIFRDDTRSTTNIEQAYLGLLYVPPAGGVTGNISAGRQTFTLNDGFLISQFGSQYNAGPRPGVYLAPRTALDNSVLGRLSWGPWTLQGFYLDPNEYEPLETNTTVLGANLRYTVTPSFFGDLTAFTVPTSRTTYQSPSGVGLPREGLLTTSAHLRWADAAVLNGVWVEGEIAHQSNANFPMDAWAGYGTIGYIARDLPWTPSLSYRLADFSGDNPNTRTYERFDPVYSGGLSEWLQGISISKAFNPANRISHRVRLNVSPNRGLDITVDWFSHRANFLYNPNANRALAQLGSTNLGQEWQTTVRWSINANLYFLGIAGIALPGKAVQLAVPDAAKPWSTLQAQLFWTL